MKCEICNRKEAHLHQMHNLSFCENCRLNDSRRLNPQTIENVEEIITEVIKAPFKIIGELVKTVTKKI